MIITRDQIIETIHKKFENHPYVYALWLEGADSTNTVDEYSDIDFWMDVKDQYMGSVFEEIEVVLASISPLDQLSESEIQHPKLRHKIYHLENTSEFLIIDFVLQCHSRDPKESIYYIGDLIEAPKVLFDKANVIRYTDKDEIALQEKLGERLYHLEQTFSHMGVRKYVARGELIEAIAIYHRYVIDPLVELLRIRYTPRHHYYGPVHISRHLPKKIVSSLESLHKISSSGQLLENIFKAERLFEETMEMLKKEPTKA